MSLIQWFGLIVHCARLGASSGASSHASASSYTSASSDVSTSASSGASNIARRSESSCASNFLLLVLRSNCARSGARKVGSGTELFLKVELVNVLVLLSLFLA